MVIFPDFHTPVAARITLDNFKGPVSRAIIGDKDFYVLLGLRQNAVEGGTDKGLTIKYWQADTDERLQKGSSQNPETLLKYPKGYLKLIPHTGAWDNQALVTNVPVLGGGTAPTGVYAGMSNKQIMESAWPEIFNVIPEKAQQEIFAELLPVNFGFTDWKYKSGPNSGQLGPVYHDRNFQYTDFTPFPEQFPCARYLHCYLINFGKVSLPSEAGSWTSEHGKPSYRFISCPAFNQ